MEAQLVRRIVLCVSDDPSGLLLYRSVLELDGYPVLLAGAAEEALELSKDETVDCVVLDHAGDGTVLAKEIGGRQPAPPVVFVLDGPEMPVQIYPYVEMFITR